MRESITAVLPWLALGFALLGMREWDWAFPVSLVILIFLFWAINWLAHHISLSWRRYLRFLFWALVIGAFIVVPPLRASLEEVVKGLLSLQSSTLIVLSILTLIAWAVVGLSRPAQQSNS